VCDFNGLVLGVIGRQNAIHNRFGPIDGKVAVQFHHRVTRIDGVIAIHLNFVIVLRTSGGHPEPMEGDQVELNSKQASQFHGAFASSS
jgi:hypothetical protein